MTSAALANLLRMLAGGRDTALVRFSIGSEYLKSGEGAAAVEHLRAALKHDPGYSAAWKLLGRALESCDDLSGALDAYRDGIAVAERKGDKQAAKEMGVFTRRLERRTSSSR